MLIDDYGCFFRYTVFFIDYLIASNEITLSSEIVSLSHPTTVIFSGN